MSYLYLGQTSGANGTRDRWAGATADQTSGTSAGTVNGALVTGVADSAFDEAALQGIGWAAAESYADGQLLATDRSRALYDLSGANAASTDSSFNAALNSALTNTGNLLGVGGAFDDDGSANNRTLDNASGYTAALGVQKLDLGLSDLNWNDIKNVEVFIDSSDTGTGFDALALRSFVDARVKIGDTEGCRDAAELVDVLNGTAAKFAVEIVDGKRGQVDGSQSDLALDVSIDVWTNGSGWQNSFSNDGSVFSDSFTIGYGSLAVVRGLSEFGLGAGRLVDASDTGFGTDSDQQSAYNGQLTTLFTNLGAGDDSYDATEGVRVVASGRGTAAAAGELQTIDYVWGGSGDDRIAAGGNNDVLYGDFGGANGIRQSTDPAALSLKLGAAGDGFANWAVDGVVSEIWQKNLGNAALVATAANWDQQFRLNPGYGTALVAGGLGVGNDSAGPNNAPTEGNPEINTGTTGASNGNPGDDDVLGVSFVAAMAAAKVGFGLFYADEHVESALVTLTSGGAEIATYKVGGDGSIALVSGVGGFSVSLAGGGDRWNGSNPGESTLHIDALSGATFDGIAFRSGGNSGTDEVSDFYVTDICTTLAAAEGNDTIDGGGDSGRYTIATGAVIVGDDITGGGGEDTFIWGMGDGLDVIRDFDVEGDRLIFNDGGARTVSAITFAGQDSTLVRSSASATDGVVLQGVKVADLGAGDLLTALTVDFDDVVLSDGGETKIVDGYNGFDWTQAAIFNPDTTGSLAYLNYLETSSPNVGFIAEANEFEVDGYNDPGEIAGAPVVITRDTDFDFVGGSFTPSGRAGMVVTVQGWDDGVLRFSQAVALGTVDPDSSTTAVFDFTSIDELRFNANDANAGTNDYFGFDDLRFLV